MLPEEGVPSAVERHLPRQRLVNQTCQSDMITTMMTYYKYVFKYYRYKTEYQQGSWKHQWQQKHENATATDELDQEQ